MRRALFGSIVQESRDNVGSEIIDLHGCGGQGVCEPAASTSDIDNRHSIAKPCILKDVALDLPNLAVASANGASHGLVPRISSEQVLDQALIVLNEMKLSHGPPL